MHSSDGHHPTHHSGERTDLDYVKQDVVQIRKSLEKSIHSNDTKHIGNIRHEISSLIKHLNNVHHTSSHIDSSIKKMHGVMAVVERAEHSRDIDSLKHVMGDVKECERDLLSLEEHAHAHSSSGSHHRRGAVKDSQSDPATSHHRRGAVHHKK